MPLPDTVGPLPGHQVSHEAVVVLAAHEPLPLEDLAPSLDCRDPGSLPPEPVSGDAVLAALVKLDLARTAIAVLPLTGSDRSLYAATGHYEEEERMAGSAAKLKFKIVKLAAHVSFLQAVIVALFGASIYIVTNIYGSIDDNKLAINKLNLKVESIERLIFGENLTGEISD